MAHEPASAEVVGTDVVGADAPDSLSPRDRAILAFELRSWRHTGEKEEAIRREFGIAAARYYQLLNALVDSPAALVHDPMLVRRLQRVRDDHRVARTTRSDSTDQAGSRPLTRTRTTN